MIPTYNYNEFVDEKDLEQCGNEIKIFVRGRVMNSLKN